MKIKRLNRLLGGSILLTIAVSTVMVVYTIQCTSRENIHMIDIAFDPKEENLIEQSQKECQPKKNIAFSKTHKCASSTVQNILFRFGFNRNLTFLLPPPKSFQFISRGCPSFSEDWVQDAPWHQEGYNICATHLFWNSTSIKSIMPRDTKYIAIIRNPIDVFEAIYDYYHFSGKYIMNMTLKEYLHLKEPSEELTKRMYCLGRNQMLFDFGLQVDQLFNQSAVINKILEIEQEFNLILIAEYMDESLVLLRDMMCWSTEDIMYMSLNQRMGRQNQNFTSWEKNQLLRLNKEDDMLYQYFVEKLKKKIELYGKQKLKREVVRLREAIQSLHKSCVIDETFNKPMENRFQPYGKDILSYHVQPSEYCSQFATTELYFMEMIRKTQFLSAAQHRETL